MIFNVIMTLNIDERMYTKVGLFVLKYSIMTLPGEISQKCPLYPGTQLHV
jgi:hypothetical protein